MAIIDKATNIEKIRLNEKGEEVYNYDHPLAGQLVPPNERHFSGKFSPPKSLAEIQREQEAQYDQETLDALSVLKNKGLL